MLCTFSRGPRELKPVIPSRPLTTIANDSHVLISKVNPILPPRCVNDLSLKESSARNVVSLRIDQTSDCRDEQLALLSKNLLCPGILQSDNPGVRTFLPFSPNPFNTSLEMAIHAVPLDNRRQIM